MMAPPDPPSFAELLDWLEGRLPAAQVQALASRLEAASPAALADLDWLRQFLAARQSVRLAAPPPAVRAELRRRFAARVQAQANPLPGLFARLTAALTFDSRAQWAGAGLRASGGATGDRQLIYATPSAEIEIALNLHAIEAPALESQHLDLNGQVFAAAGSPPVYAVQLLRAGAEVALAATDELGEFAIVSIPSGDYELVLSAGDHEIQLASVMLET
jgi:hypothetical protein